MPFSGLAPSKLIFFTLKTFRVGYVYIEKSLPLLIYFFMEGGAYDATMSVKIAHARES